MESSSDTRIARLILAIVCACVFAGAISSVFVDRAMYTLSDELGYYAWQQSWLSDFDLDPSNQLRQNPTPFYPDEVMVDGRSVVLNKYSTGVSMAMLPLTAPAYAIDRWIIQSEHPYGPGNSALQVRAARWAISMWAIVGIIAAYVAVRAMAGASATISAMAVACAWAGTSAFAYSWKLPLWSHGAGLAMVALAYAMAVMSVRNPSSRRILIALGFFAAMAVCVRLTHVVLLAPAMWWWMTRTDSASRWKSIPWIGIGGFAPLAVELSTRYLIYGQLFFNGYAAKGEGFSFPPPHLWDVLFFFGAFEQGGGQGLFSIHPITLASIAGLLILMSRRSTRWFAIGLLATIAITVVMYGSWWFWNLGYSFGARWAADFLVVWAIGLAVLIKALHASRPRRAVIYLLPLVFWSLVWCVGGVTEEPASPALATVEQTTD